MEQTIQTLSIRVDKLEKDTAELLEKTNNVVIVQATINEKFNSVLVTLGELKAGLQVLQQQPTKKWEMLIGAFLGALFAAGAGLLVSKFM